MVTSFEKMRTTDPDPTRVPIDWSPLQMHLPSSAAPAPAVGPHNVGYYICNTSGASVIISNGFRECDKEALPGVALALKLVTSLPEARRVAQERYGAEGVVLEAHYRGTPVRLSSAVKKLSAGTPLTFNAAGIEYVLVRDLEAIVRTAIVRP
jgi:hypothetical protein